MEGFSKQNLAKTLCGIQDTAIIVGGKLNPPFDHPERLLFCVTTTLFGLHCKLPDQNNPDQLKVIEKTYFNILRLQFIAKVLKDRLATLGMICFHGNKKDINVPVSHPSTVEKLKQATMTCFFLNLNQNPTQWKQGVSYKLVQKAATKPDEAMLVPHENIDNTFLIKTPDIREHPKGSKLKSETRGGLTLWKVQIHLDDELICESPPFIRGNGGSSCAKYLCDFWNVLHGRKRITEKRKRPISGATLVRKQKKMKLDVTKMTEQSDAFELELKHIWNPTPQQTSINKSLSNGDVVSSDLSAGKHSPFEVFNNTNTQEFADEALAKELFDDANK